MSKSSPIIVAHRGLHKRVPENSLAAFTAVRDEEIHWVECDIWPSSDGVPIVIHDETLDRTTAGNGDVRQHSWSELQRLNLPSLSEVLAVLNGTGILVEIKPANAGDFVNKVVDLLCCYCGPWMVQSFHLKNIARLDRSIATALLIEDPQVLDVYWPSIHVEHRLIDRTLVESVHRGCRQIGAWTVNEPADIQRVVGFGVDMLITDEPALAAQIIATQ